MGVWRTALTALVGVACVSTAVRATGDAETAQLLAEANDVPDAPVVAGGGADKKQRSIYRKDYGGRYASAFTTGGYQPLYEPAYGARTKPTEHPLNEHFRKVAKHNAAKHPPIYDSSNKLPYTPAKYYVYPKYEAEKVHTKYETKYPLYEAPKYEKPLYQAPKYEKPLYEAPKYEKPLYEAPKYEKPLYESLQYDEKPVYETPKYTEGYPKYGDVYHESETTKYAGDDAKYFTHEYKYVQHEPTYPPQEKHYPKHEDSYPNIHDAFAKYANSYVEVKPPHDLYAPPKPVTYAVPEHGPYVPPKPDSYAHPKPAPYPAPHSYPPPPPPSTIYEAPVVAPVRPQPASPQQHHQPLYKPEYHTYHASPESYHVNEEYHVRGAYPQYHAPPPPPPKVYSSYHHEAVSTRGHRAGKSLGQFTFNPEPFIETIALAYHENEKNFKGHRKPKYIPVTRFQHEEHVREFASPHGSQYHVQQHVQEVTAPHKVHEPPHDPRHATKYGYKTKPHTSYKYAGPEKTVTLAPYRVQVGSLYGLQAAGSETSSTVVKPATGLSSLAKVVRSGESSKKTKKA